MYVSRSVCQFFNYATQQYQTLHVGLGVNKSGNKSCHNRKFFECDLQSISEKFQTYNKRLLASIATERRFPTAL